MATIHPTAIVEDGAQLGADVEIGPYAHIGPHVTIGDGTFVRQGAIVDGHTTIGAQCQIFPYALIGMKTQDLKYKDGSTSYIEIGDRTVIREFATVHLGTADGEKTVIGSDCLFMCYCHAAHGVILGNHVICSNSVQLAGDVHVDDYAIIGGMTGSHQFCHIGRHAMVGGAAKIRQDFPPYMLGDMVEGSLKVIGPNVVGLTRRGFSRDVIHALKDAHRFLYRDGLNRTQALDRVENDVEPFDEVKELVAFYRNSQRGVS
ncbi:MAG: acyl-ACP--UDP-N-acetylglucosamine O-acyltransferase [Kiritimatiellae bacterium]|jgi:UDP-N-acetylglucosamine acyltransferase|nr:acyl-ACP--UDP-N-acetylglucosamine O-acyltransferase [Kiritimatiellia bacterium]